MSAASSPTPSTRRRAVAALAALPVLLAGCATGKGSEPAASATGSFGPSATIAAGPLQVMGFGGEDEVGQARLALAKQAIAPATLDQVKGDLDIQQFLSAVASGKPPEVVYANRDQIGTLASRGAIIPLDQCISAEGIATKDFVPSALAQTTFAGKVYGIPEFNSVQITMANADLLAKAGATVADVDGSSWEKATAANARLARTEGGKLAVIGLDSKLPEFLPLWAKANGADLVSADGRTARLDDPKVVEALTWAVKIYTDQGGFQKVKAFRDSADFFGKGNQFASGTLGAMPMEQWYLNVLNDVSPQAPMAFGPVRTRAGEPIAWASGSAWAIPTKTKNPAAACRFVRTMTATDAWMAAAKARADKRQAEGKPFTGLLTGNRAADTRIRSTYVKGAPAPWSDGIAAVYEADAHAFALPALPAGEEFTTAYKDAVNRVLNGQATPQESLARAQKQAQAALDAAWRTWDATK